MAYFNAGSRALKAVLGFSTEWIPSAVPTVSSNSGALTAAAPEKSDHFVNAGRSVYYGLTVTIADAIGGFWLSVLFQALIVVWAIGLLVQLFAPRHPFLAPVIVIALALFTSISFFASFLMPDFLTGIVVIAAAALLTGWPRMRLAVRCQWLMLLLFGLISHNTNIVITGMLLAVGFLLVWIVGRRAPLAGGLALVATLAAALGLQAAAGLAVSMVYHAESSNPPFLTATLAEDPPGYHYLRDTCPDNGFRVCKFIGQLPEDSNDFLWSHEPGRALYATASDELRSTLSSEQFPFALAVLRHDFFGQLAASFDHFVAQLRQFSLLAVAYSPGLNAHLLELLPRDRTDELRASRLYEGRLPLSRFNLVNRVAIALSLVGIVIFLIRDFPRSGTVDLSRQLWLFVMLVILGVVFNAAVTGVLSNVTDRYQARVIWLIPAAALLIAASRRGALLSALRRARAPSPGDRNVAPAVT
ncbi:MAG: hypothetical protein ABIT04_08615 [Novosphingobium sp.]